MRDLRLELEKIETRRIDLGISRSRLEQAAGLCQRQYYQNLSGRHEPRPATIGALKLALSRLSGDPAADLRKESILHNMVLRLAIALVCSHRGLDAQKVQAADPKKRATQSKEWMEAAEARRIAITIVNAALGITGADLARATGVTKAAISLALKDMWDRREDPAFDAELERLENAVIGEW